MISRQTLHRINSLIIDTIKYQIPHITNLNSRMLLSIKYQINKQTPTQYIT